MVPFDFEPRTRVVFGRGTVQRVGHLARGLHFQRVLLVADRGVLGAGHVSTATRALESEHVVVEPYHEFGENPDSSMIEAGRRFAAPLRIDSIVALGGGSALDCAKGINFVLTNGGGVGGFCGLREGAPPPFALIWGPATAGAPGGARGGPG